MEPPRGIANAPMDELLRLVVTVGVTPVYSASDSTNNRADNRNHKAEAHEREKER